MTLRINSEPQSNGPITKKGRSTSTYTKSPKEEKKDQTGTGVDLDPQVYIGYSCRSLSTVIVEYEKIISRLLVGFHHKVTPSTLTQSVSRS